MLLVIFSDLYFLGGHQCLWQGRSLLSSTLFHSAQKSSFELSSWLKMPSTDLLLLTRSLQNLNIPGNAEYLTHSHLLWISQIQFLISKEKRILNWNLGEIRRTRKKKFATFDWEDMVAKAFWVFVWVLESWGAELDYWKLGVGGDQDERVEAKTEWRAPIWSESWEASKMNFIILKFCLKWSMNITIFTWLLSKIHKEWSLFLFRN